MAATTNGGPKSIPLVKLDSTLYDLLKADLKDGEEMEALCKLKPNSDPQYGHAVPFNDKYIIHSAQVSTAENLAHLQLENTSHLLMFFAGPMRVLFMGSEGNTDDPTLSAEDVGKNAARSFSVIQESQRPRITTFKNTEDFVKRYDGAPIRWGFAMDFAERLPSLVHPELTYKLNSKKWLAECVLRSANDRVVDCSVNCKQHAVTDELWYHRGADCNACAEGVKEEIQRVREILLHAKIPFVLKLTQSLASVGTNIVQDEEARDKLVDSMTHYLADFLPRITKGNRHLYTTSLILSEFVPGPTHALNFHVRKDGSVVFLGACNQLATGESGRQSTAITYADQPKLQPKFQSTLDAIGKVLCEEGYHGPVGADIMEDPDSGRLFCIDLNVRVPLSLVLYLLKGHFNDRFGYGVATVYECTMLSISREELERKFEREFAEARILILGAARMGKKKVWAFGLVVAGEDTEAIEKVTERVLEDEATEDEDAEAGGA